MLNHKQSLLVAYTLLDDIHDETHESSLRELLADMNPFIFTDRTSADPATWNEWVVCAEEIQKGDSMASDNVFSTLVSFLKFNEIQYGYDTHTIVNKLQSPSYRERRAELLEKAATLTDI